MKFDELNERYYSLFQENLPFAADEYELASDESGVTNREDLLSNYELRYDGPSSPRNDRDHDFVSFLNALKSRDDEHVAYLLALAKRHYLTFIFQVDYAELICVFPIKTWKMLVEQDGDNTKI